MGSGFFGLTVAERVASQLDKKVLIPRPAQAHRRKRLLRTPNPKRALAESTIRSAYTILRAVLDTAGRDGALASNPAAAVRRPRVTIKEAPHLTPGQVAALLQAARGTRYALLVHTGLRRGEALALQWTDVDLERHTLHVRGTLSRVDGALVVTEPKTAKSRRFVPISTPAAALLRVVHAAQDVERRQADTA